MCPNMHWTIVESLNVFEGQKVIQRRHRWRASSGCLDCLDLYVCHSNAHGFAHPPVLRLQRLNAGCSAQLRCANQKRRAKGSPGKNDPKMASSSIRHHFSSVVSFPTSSPVLSLVVDSLQKLRQLHTSGGTVGFCWIGWAHLLQLHTACSISGFVSFTAKVAAEPQSTGATGRRRLSSVILVPLSPATPCNWLRLLKTLQNVQTLVIQYQATQVSTRWQYLNVGSCAKYKSASWIFIVSFKSNIFNGPAWSMSMSCLSVWTQLAFPLADGLFTLGHKNGAQLESTPNDFYQC